MRASPLLRSFALAAALAVAGVPVAAGAATLVLTLPARAVRLDPRVPPDPDGGFEMDADAGSTGLIAQNCAEGGAVALVVPNADPGRPSQPVRARYATEVKQRRELHEQVRRLLARSRTISLRVKNDARYLRRVRGRWYAPNCYLTVDTAWRPR